MSQAKKMLQSMARNPRADWTIENVQTVCAHAGVSCTKPSAGSHYNVSHPTQEKILTIPHGRPIKPVYIKLLVAYIKAVEASSTDG
jgi:hypothetical protein